MRVVARRTGHPVARSALACALQQCFPLACGPPTRRLISVYKESRVIEQVIAGSEVFGLATLSSHGYLSFEMAVEADRIAAHRRHGIQIEHVNLAVGCDVYGRTPMTGFARDAPVGEGSRGVVIARVGQ